MLVPMLMFVIVLVGMFMFHESSSFHLGRRARYARTNLEVTLSGTC